MKPIGRRASCWVERDGVMHMGHFDGSTLCGTRCEPHDLDPRYTKPGGAVCRRTKCIVVCVQSPPKVVTCQGCLDAGAMNYPEPEDGVWTDAVFDPYMAQIR